MGNTDPLAGLLTSDLFLFKMLYCEKWLDNRYCIFKYVLEQEQRNCACIEDNLDEKKPRGLC